MAIDGNTAVVGVPEDDVVVGGSTYYRVGSVRVYVRSGTTWSLQAKLTATVFDSNMLLGETVSISGDYILATAPDYRHSDVGTGDQRGQAYIFYRSGSTWSLQQVLVPTDYTSQNMFAASGAIYGDIAVVGDSAAFNDDGNTSGAQYIFQRSGTTWTQTKKIMSSDGANSDSFGFRQGTDVDASTIIAGANAKDGGQGKAYIFDKG